MKRADDRTITDLTTDEIDAIATRLLNDSVDAMARHGGDICAPEWEDVPMLSEAMWEAVTVAMKAYVVELRARHRQWQSLRDIDSTYLIDEAQA